jgi:16S rRNA (cytosine1402-N4)-methyltransferase
MEFFHPSVLLNEVSDLFIKNENGVYVDVTCGGGGHSYALLKKYPNIKMICSDWDLNAIKATEKRLAEFEDRVTIIFGSMSMVHESIKKSGFNKVDGILADFGTSREQIKSGEGFSFMHDTYLDMRMSKGHSKITAADIIKKATEKELADIFFIYGEERFSRKIAKAIIEERKEREIKTTIHLADLIEKVIGRSSKIHPATRVFQALRIFVNSELKQIEAFLKNSINNILSGGILMCISFHSLEDKIVKQFYKLNKNLLDSHKPEIIIPTKEEVTINHASRSAKMRILYKKC